MAATTADVVQEVTEVFGQVPSWLKDAPETALAAVWTVMRDFYLAETTIPAKYKELIGLAVAAATRCRYCALFHTEAARVFGATDAEIAEATMMGDFTMLATTFIHADEIDYEQFKRETLEIIAFVKQVRDAPPRQRGTRPAHA